MGTRFSRLHQMLYRHPTCRRVLSQTTGRQPVGVGASEDEAANSFRPSIAATATDGITVTVILTARVDLAFLNAVSDQWFKRSGHPLQ